MSEYYEAAGFKVMGNPTTNLHIVRTMEVNKYPTTVVYNEATNLNHNVTITRVRMWTPKSQAVFWVNDPARGANYRWTDNALRKVMLNWYTIGGIQ